MDLQHDVSLAPLTTLRLGGPARFFVTAEDDRSLCDALRFAKARRLGVRLLGGGSNVVIHDDGFEGLVIHMQMRGRRLHREDSRISLVAAAGEPWDDLVAYAVAEGLVGLECLSGIPGQVGATPIQNVGAYGREVGELITAVRVMERASLAISELSPQTCAFGYRTSAFKTTEQDRWLVLDVTYRLQPDASPVLRHGELTRALIEQGIERPTAAEARAAVLAVRGNKSMLEDPTDPNGRSCGSFFVNPILTPAELTWAETRTAAQIPRYELEDGRFKVPAAWLIEHAGFSKGFADGPVALSTKHSLAIVAHEGARAADVVRLARRVRAGVTERFGVRLHPEPAFWGFDRLEDGLPAC